MLTALILLVCVFLLHQQREEDLWNANISGGSFKAWFSTMYCGFWMKANIDGEWDSALNNKQ